MNVVENFDFGGRELHVSETITDELLGTIQGLNRDLGTPNDPYYDEFRSFVSEINDVELVLIDPNILSKTSYEDMDLSGMSSNVNPFVELLMLAIGSKDPFYMGNIGESYGEVINYSGTDYYFTDEWMSLENASYPIVS